jgi:hypothetical protein
MNNGRLDKLDFGLDIQKSEQLVQCWEARDAVSEKE